MAKKAAVVDYHACQPELCEAGVCRAALTCPRKLLRQEAPYEPPDAPAALCVGCALCVAACRRGAVRIAIV